MSMSVSTITNCRSSCKEECGSDATLIGVIDGPIRRNAATSDLTNKVGGAPDVPPGIAWPCPLCALCGTPLVHVLQAQCPLDASPYCRALHVLACCRSACWGRAESWAALRSQRLAREEASPSLPVPMATTAWCDDADDWGGEEEGGRGGGTLPEEEQLEQMEELEARVHELSLKAGEPDSQQMAADLLQAFYISVEEEEELAADEDLGHAQRLLQEYEEREGVVGGADGAPAGPEAYEKAAVRHGDEIFRRFMKRIERCPAQVLRYCRGGPPLLLHQGALGPAPPCPSCGEQRTFELQLMPALVNTLRRTASDPEPAVEFGTVLVFTCRGSCWAAGGAAPREEVVLVQGDPDQELFT